MLKKLIRHEWKETWRIPALILATAGLLTAALWFYFTLAKAPAPDVELNVGHFVLFISYALLISFISLLLTIYFGVRFYKNMYTDEGYLMHTLPVKPWMHIVAKTCIFTIWGSLATLFTIAALTLICFASIPKLTYFSPQDLEELSVLLDNLRALGAAPPLWALITFILSASYTALNLYASISLGQLMGKHKIMASILCYLGLNTLVSTVTSIAITPFMAGLIIDSTTLADSAAYTAVMSRIFTISYTINAVFSLVGGVLFFWVTNHIISKNLNLD